jgi:hypothetical protein
LDPPDDDWSKEMDGWMDGSHLSVYQFLKFKSIENIEIIK